MYIHLNEVDSTNNFAAREELPAGTVVWADAQTAGRGRGYHSFASPKGGIYFSCIFMEATEDEEINRYGYISEKDALLLTPKAAVSVSIALEEICGLKPSIKWVNDIYFNEKKVCGILCEHVGDKYIAGIGINTSDEFLPPQLKNTAGGIGDAPGEKLINRICELMYSGMSKDSVVSEYSSRLGILGKRISFTDNGHKKTGVAAGINEYCNLLVDTDQGTYCLNSGEIQLI